MNQQPQQNQGANERVLALHHEESLHQRMLAVQFAFLIAGEICPLMEYESSTQAVVCTLAEYGWYEFEIRKA